MEKHEAIRFVGGPIDGQTTKYKPVNKLRVPDEAATRVLVYRKAEFKDGEWLYMFSHLEEE